MGSFGVWCVGVKVAVEYCPADAFFSFDVSVLFEALNCGSDIFLVPADSTFNRTETALSIISHESGNFAHDYG